MPVGLPELILLIFFGVFIALGVWFVQRARNRPCPRCGRWGKQGVMTCQECGFDFSSVGSATRG